MSGIQAIPGSSAFELQASRVMPIEFGKEFGSDKPIAIGAQPAVGKQEGSSEFDRKSEEDKKKQEEELKKMNEALASYGKQIRVRYNEEAKQTYVEVVDTKSQKVVASRPPEFLIDLSVKMKELVGFFMDKKL